MNYSVYASVNDAVVAIQNKPDFEGFVKDHPECYNIIMNNCEHTWNVITYGDSFYGGGTEKVVKDFMGEHSYEAKLTASIESQLETETFYKKRFRFHNRQIVGNRVDIPRYLNGDQRYWFAIKKIKLPNKAIRVFAPMGGLWNISERQMQVCGAVTCAVVEALETQGISVELWASCCCRGVFGNRNDATAEELKTLRADPDWKNICHLIKLKDSSQYCDYGMINYVTGNSGFYRNVIFKDRILTGMRGMSRGLCYISSGASCDFERSLIPPDEDYDPKNDIIIPRIYELDKAKSWLEHTFVATVTGGINAEPSGEGEGEGE